MRLLASLSIVGAGVVLAGCNLGRHGQPITMSAPAGSDALACALRVSADSTYLPVDGGVASGYLVVQRGRGITKGDVAAETAARMSTMFLVGRDRLVADRLRVIGGDGQLRVIASSLDPDRKDVGPSDEAKAFADYVLASCAGGR